MIKKHFGKILFSGSAYTALFAAEQLKTTICSIGNALYFADKMFSWRELLEEFLLDWKDQEDIQIL